jgi:hypothetical protein
MECFCVLKTCELLKLPYAKIFYLFIGLFVFGNGQNHHHGSVSIFFYYFVDISTTYFVAFGKGKSCVCMHGCSLL